MSFFMKKFGIVLHVSNYMTLDEDLRKVGCSPESVLINNIPKIPWMSRKFIRIGLKKLPVPLQKFLIKYKIDTLIGKPEKFFSHDLLISHCEELQWDSVLLTHQTALIERADKLKQLVDLFKTGNLI